MKIRDEYSSWPLGRQLQVLFIGAGFLLTGILIIITKFQLDWLRSQVTTKSDSVLTDNLLKQMRDLGLMEAQFISSEFSDYISFVKNLKRTDSIILGFGYYNNNNPFSQGTIAYSTSFQQGVSNYSTGAFFSSESSLSSSGIKLENAQTSLDPIYPLIYRNSYLGYYQGYEIDQIIHYYPGSLATDTSYTPLVREWYYKAAKNTSQVIITEPYTDSGTGYWIVTISNAITDNNNNLYGVAGVDVTLKRLTSVTSNVKVLDTGFLMLVSAGGMILTLPASWEVSGISTLRIYDTANTGITSDQWNKIQTSDDGTEIDFSDVNGTNYIMVKYNIMPFTNSDQITHYLLVCAKTNETRVAINQIISNFSHTYNVIFWVIISLAIVVFLSIALLVYFASKRVSMQMKLIEKLIWKIIRRSLFPNVTSKIEEKSYDKLEKNSQGIESLIVACKDKINRLTNLEKHYSYYQWGPTRPTDELLYLDWSKCIYPINNCNDHSTGWTNALNDLKKVVG